MPGCLRKSGCRICSGKVRTTRRQLSLTVPRLRALRSSSQAAGVSNVVYLALYRRRLCWHLRRRSLRPASGEAAMTDKHTALGAISASLRDVRSARALHRAEDICSRRPFTGISPLGSLREDGRNASAGATSRKLPRVSGCPWQKIGAAAGGRLHRPTRRSVTTRVQRLARPSKGIAASSSRVTTQSIPTCCAFTTWQGNCWHPAREGRQQSGACRAPPAARAQRPQRLLRPVALSHALGRVLINRDCSAIAGCRNTCTE